MTAGLRRSLALAAAVMAALACLTSATPTAAQQAPDYLSWANPGPYLSSNGTDFTLDSFGANQPLVTTYFFYWFDATFLSQQSRGFGVYPYHPTDQDTMSFYDPNWYHKQFTDMLAAGVDFVLPDYWGEPGQYNRRVAPAPELNLFATQGLPPMVTALEQLDQEGHPLKIGLFLDTTILNDEDLTTDRGKQILYASVRDYYSKIPPHLWAAIGGQPVVWLYDAQKVSAFDQSTFDYVNDHFAQDFGGLRPYIVREDQWYTERAPTNRVIQTEGMYGWGAAVFGYNPDRRYTISQVGPGFNNTRLGDGPNRFNTDRQDGAFFRDGLEQALVSGRRIVAVETWNELGEGSGILETQEFGRQYIDILRGYADRLKASSRT
ncbi:MAG TPA: DUF5010 domain-containing protein [Chloroflexota bacterium]